MRLQLVGGLRLNTITVKIKRLVQCPNLEVLKQLRMTCSIYLSKVELLVPDILRILRKGLENVLEVILVIEPSIVKHKHTGISAVCDMRALGIEIS